MSERSLLRQFESDPAVAYVLDEDLNIIWCNRSWDRFAAENGAPDLASPAPLTKSVMAVIPAELALFYREAFASVAHDRREFTHVFECSSSAVFRRMQMRILPIAESNFLIVNSLVYEGPHTRLATTASEIYRDDHGLIDMCAHCRRVKSQTDEDRWDWVPEFVDTPLAGVSHGLCGFCRTYHYPNVRHRAAD